MPGHRAILFFLVAVFLFQPAFVLFANTQQTGDFLLKDRYSLAQLGVVKEIFQASFTAIKNFFAGILQLALKKSEPEATSTETPDSSRPETRRPLQLPPPTSLNEEEPTNTETEAAIAQTIPQEEPPQNSGPAVSSSLPPASSPPPTGGPDFLSAFASLRSELLSLFETKISSSQPSPPIVYYSAPVASPHRNEPAGVASGVVSPYGDFLGISTGGNLSAAGNVTLGGDGKAVTINTTLNVDGVSGLTDADVPDTITASNYLALTGGSLSGALTATNLTLSGNLTVSGAQTLSGAIEVPYINATSTTATSTFSGAISLATTASNGAGAILSNGSLYIHNAGSFNFFAGVSAGNLSLTGTTNVGVGFSALPVVTSGSDNVAIGAAAMLSNTTGSVNTAVGRSALRLNTTGTENTGIGSSALFSNSTGRGNTSVGYNTLRLNTAGDFNTAFGRLALEANTIGTFNSAFGNAALLANTIGSRNVAIGHGALIANTTGSSTVAVGINAGATNTTGLNNLFLGYGADALSAALTNAAAIGYNAKVGASNSLVLGGTGADAINVGIGTTSPYAKLSVAGPTVAEYFHATSTTATSTFAGGAVFATGGGNVGIGTSNPSTLLTIRATEQPAGSNPFVTFTQTSSSAHARPVIEWYSENDSYTMAKIGAQPGSNYDAPSLHFEVADSSHTLKNRLSIDSTGQISNIGTPVSAGSTVIKDQKILSFNLPTASEFAQQADFWLGRWEESANAARSALMISLHNGATEPTDADTDVLTLLSNGNVGIGTTSPYAKLSVTNTDTGPSFIVEDDTSPDSTPFIIDASGNVGIGIAAPTHNLDIRSDSEVGVNIHYTGGASSGARLRFRSDSSDSGEKVMELRYGNNEQLEFRALSDSGSALLNTPLVIQSSGNVGIGTTTPGTKLGVQGDIVGAGVLTVSSVVATSTTATSTFSGGLIVGSNNLWVSPNGNIGIGTTSPVTPLHVSKGSGLGSNLRLESITGNAALTLRAGSLQWTAFLNSGWNYFQLWSDTANDEVLAVETTGGLSLGTYAGNGNNPPDGGLILPGNVGIGTTTPGAKLAITGGGTGTGRAFAVADSSNAEKFTILDNGNVGIGTTNPFELLSIAGNIVSTGIIKAANGTAAAPSITFSADTSDGLYRTSGGALGFASGGISRMSIVTGSHPLVRIDRSLAIAESGEGNTDLALVREAANILGLKNGTNGQTFRIFNTTDTTSGYEPGSGTNFEYLDLGWSGNVFQLQTAAGGTGSVRDLSLQPTAGNVGIGTTSPGRLLSVQGDGLLSGNLSLAGLTATGTVNFSGTSATTTMAGGLTVDGSTFVVDYSSGRVGIGIANPSSELMVNGDIAIGPGAGVAWPLLKRNTSQGGLIVDTNSDIGSNIVMSVRKNGGTDLMTILGTGNLGIGTTNPGAPLAVKANSSADGIYILNNSSVLNTDLGLDGATGNARWRARDATGNVDIQFSANDSVPSYIKSGNVGIGTTTPWRKLSVTGTVGFDGLTAGAAGNALCLSANKEVTASGANDCTASSLRFKENVEDITVGLDLLMQLRPTEFTYKESQRRAFGLIAEEVDKLDPRLVSYDEEGLPRSVHYTEMSALLVKAIQELNLKIDNLGGAGFSDGESGSIVSSILDWLTDKVVSAKEFIADKITAKTARVNNLEIIDKATGEIYCTWIENGKWIKEKGSCGQDNSSKQEPSQSLEPQIENSSVSPPAEDTSTSTPSEISEPETPASPPTSQGGPAEVSADPEPAEQTTPESLEPTDSPQPPAEPAPTEEAVPESEPDVPQEAISTDEL